MITDNNFTYKPTTIIIHLNRLYGGNDNVYYVVNITLFIYIHIELKKILCISLYWFFNIMHLKITFYSLSPFKIPTVRIRSQNSDS